MKIFKIFVLMAFFGVVSSCTDDARQGVILQDTTGLTGELTLVGDHFGPGISVPFNFTIPQSFSQKANVTVQALSNEIVETLATVQIDAGATSGSGSITLPSTAKDLGGYDITANFVTVKIIGISLLDEVDNNGTIELVPSSNDTFTLSSNEVSLDFYSRLPAQSGSGNFSYLLDWDNPATADIDLQVIDRGFTRIYEDSSSGDRFESDFFNNSHPDGEYDFYFRIYGTDDPTTADIPYRLFTVQPDGTRNLYEGVIPAGSPAGGARIDFASLTASGDDFIFVID